MVNSERAAALLAGAAEKHILLSALDDRSTLVRLVAAIRLAEHSPRSLPERSVRELLGTLDGLQRGEPLDVADEYSELMDYENDLGQDIVLSLAKLSPGQADFAIPALLRHWASDSSFYEIALALLALTIPSGPSAFPPELFTDTRRRVLESFFKNGPIWSACGGFGEALVARGLPVTRDGMRTLLDDYEPND